MSNIFYFSHINRIGGTEQYLYEIAKKYYMYDITVYYDTADCFQLERLRKLIRCKKRKKGEIVKCNKAFFNYNIDMIEDVEAEEYIFVSHGIFQELGYEPPIDHPKLNRWIGVSQYACDMLEEYAKKIGRYDIKVELFYNPLTLEPKEKVMLFVSAARLDDEVKGGKRIQTMIEAADRYCAKKGKHYLWLIFSNPNVRANIRSKNVVIMSPRVDVRPYIAMADYVIHLPNNMETYCYTDNEALGYRVPIVTTPLTICEELNVPEAARLICDWDMSNVDEVVKRMFEDENKEWTYNLPIPRYEDILDLTKSNYEEEKNMKCKVRATNRYNETNTSDNQLSKEESEKAGKEMRVVPKEGREWITEKERAEMLEERGFVTIIEEIKEEVKKEEEEESIKEPKKSAKRTSKKSKAGEK